MTVAELIEVNRAIRLIQRIRAICTTVIRQSRRDRDARASEEQRLASSILRSIQPRREIRPRPRRRRKGQRRRQKVDKRSNRTAGCRCARGDYARCGQRIGVRDAKERGAHNSCTRRRQQRRLCSIMSLHKLLLPGSEKSSLAIASGRRRVAGSDYIMEIVLARDPGGGR